MIVADMHGNELVDVKDPVGWTETPMSGAGMAVVVMDVSFEIDLGA